MFSIKKLQTSIKLIDFIKLLLVKSYWNLKITENDIFIIVI